MYSADIPLVDRPPVGLGNPLGLVPIWNSTAVCINKGCSSFRLSNKAIPTIPSYGFTKVFVAAKGDLCFTCTLGGDCICTMSSPGSTNVLLLNQRDDIEMRKDCLLYLFWQIQPLPLPLFDDFAPRSHLLFHSIYEPLVNHVQSMNPYWTSSKFSLSLLLLTLACWLFTAAEYAFFSRHRPLQKNSCIFFPVYTLCFTPELQFADNFQPL